MQAEMPAPGIHDVFLLASKEGGSGVHAGSVVIGNSP
jgi:hypothetical protein